MINRGTRGFLNFLFLAFSGAGFGAIIGMDRIDYAYPFLIPIYLTLGYGFLTWLFILKEDDHGFADHQTDSVYFLGFIYTLMSLVGMFLKMKTSLLSSGTGVITIVFDYLAVAVTTSIGGVVLRSLIRGAWLSSHPEPEDDLEEACRLLKTTATGLSENYKETFDGIKLFLNERADSAAAVSKKEEEYIRALDRLGEVIGTFTAGLKEAGENITGEGQNFHRNLSIQSEALTEMGSGVAGLASNIKTLNSGIESISLDGVTEDLNRFSRGTGELNLVIDSLIEILDEKVERIKV